MVAGAQLWRAGHDASLGQRSDRRRLVGRFDNALQERDWDTFIYQLGYFVVLATIYITVAVYRTYLRQMLQIKWRRWLTERLLGDWMGKQNYYRLQFGPTFADNPDQRIADDVRLMTEAAVDFFTGLLSATLMLVSFIGVLWMLSGTLRVDLFGHAVAIPG